jgi:hypothetical protein
MHATYHPTNCNIVGCDEPQNSLFLCKKHEADYLASASARRLQEEVVELLDGRADTLLRIRAYLWSRLHYITNVPVPFVEHFPLESLYLHHRRTLLDQMAANASSLRDNCNRLHAFIKDFGHPANETLGDLQWRRTWYCNDSQHAYNRSLDFSTELEQTTIFSPRTFAIVATLTFALFVVAILANKHAGTNIAVPGSLSLTAAFLWYVSCAALVLGGSVALHRLGPVVVKAQAHKLYTAAAHNTGAATIGLRVKSNFIRHLGLSYSTLVLSAVIALVVAGPWGLEGGLSAVDYAATALLAVGAWLVLFPTLRIYEQYANASVALETLPQARFVIDLHAQDGRLGIGELIDMVAAGITFNVTGLALYWIVIPSALAAQYVHAPPWIVGVGFVAYQFFILFLALPRVAQLRRLWRVRRKIIESIRLAVAEDAAAARVLPVAERHARHQSLERVRWFPLLTYSARGRLKEFVITILIPLTMLTADKIYSAAQMR